VVAAPELWACGVSCELSVASHPSLEIRGMGKDFLVDSRGPPKGERPFPDRSRRNVHTSINMCVFFRHTRLSLDTHVCVWVGGFVVRFPFLRYSLKPANAETTTNRHPSRPVAGRRPIPRVRQREFWPCRSHAGYFQSFLGMLSLGLGVGFPNPGKFSF
jgi:hypothetical protein